MRAGSVAVRAIAGSAVLAFLLTAMADGWAERAAMAAWRHRASQLSELYSAGLESALAKYDYVPKTLALHPSVFDLLHDPGNAARVAAVNGYLERLNAEAGAGDLYLLDPSGRVLAASNWQLPLSFVGMDLSYRPYFQDAMEKGQGRFYGVGTTNGQSGYYFAVAIRDGDRLLGVAAAKVSLERIEASWTPGEERVFVTDAQGVIILTSVPSWKFGMTAVLPEPVRTAVAQTRQYSSVGLKPLPLVDHEDQQDGTRLVSLGEEGPSRNEYLAHTRPLAGTGWRMTILSRLDEFRRAGRNAALVAGLAGGFLLLLLLHLYQRQSAFRQQMEAKAALQRANDALEERVAARTAALRAAQTALIQKEKLAVLGQMAAGIVHELNQPLAAMRMMTDNAAVFLQRGQPEAVLENLATSSRLVDRMGRIIGPMRSFAHTSGDPVACPVRASVACALTFVDERIRREGVVVECSDIPETLAVSGDPERLEQVLLNLFANALDAMAGQPDPHLAVSALRVGDRVVIRVRDSGPGVPPQVAERLFEPFFTTKPVGQGLGLGLVISAAIVGEFGGTLRHTPGGGGEFTIELPVAHPVPHHHDKEEQCSTP